VLAATVACGESTATAPSYPSTGLVLVSLRDGSVRSSATVGTDPVAVIVSDDGGVAYVADSAPGDVYAVRLPSLIVKWKAHVGGAPFGMVLHRGRLHVTLYDSAAIAELDPVDGRVLARDPTFQHPAAITVDSTGLVTAAGGASYGIALVGDSLWTADYKGSALLPQGLGIGIPLPMPVHPFWLAPGASNTLLIAAEGNSEDTDAGAVFSFDTVKGTFTTLARPRDPDQVEQSDNGVFVAAHGEKAVLALRGGTSERWARGASAVAIAPDATLGMLVIAVNAHE
jgi:DNA-binding beta-propeller fold protein YncE